MKVVINGEQMELAKAITVTDLLQERKVASPDMVSVEINEEILARDAFATTFLKENDTIEFLYFMGGGSAKHARITA